MGVGRLMKQRSDELESLIVMNEESKVGHGHRTRHIPNEMRAVGKGRNTWENILDMTDNGSIRLIHPALESARCDLVRCTGSEYV